MSWEMTDGDCRRCKGEGVAPTGREPQWTVLPPCDSCDGSGKGKNWNWVEPKKVADTGMGVRPATHAEQAEWERIWTDMHARKDDGISLNGGYGDGVREYSLYEINVGDDRDWVHGRRDYAPTIHDPSKGTAPPRGDDDAN